MKMQVTAARVCEEALRPASSTSSVSTSQARGEPGFLVLPPAWTLWTSDRPGPMSVGPADITWAGWHGLWAAPACSCTLTHRYTCGAA